MTFNGNMEMAGQVLHVYASGDGALHFNWAHSDSGISSGRPVKRWHCLRFLRTKEGKRLTDNGFKLYHINGFWTLVTVCVRKGPNTLLMDGEQGVGGEGVYTYTINRFLGLPRKGTNVLDCDLTVYFRYAPWADPQVQGKQYEVKNISIRAGIRYFLSHEEELNRADEKGIVCYQLPTTKE